MQCVYTCICVYDCICVYVYMCVCVCASHREDGETQHSGVARRVLWKPEGCKSRSYLDLYLFSVQKPKFGTTSRRPKAHFSVACCFSVARRAFWKPEGCKSRSYLDLYLFSVQKPKFGTTSRRPKAHFSVACCFSVARRAFWKPKGCKSVAIWTYFLISSESDLWHDQPQAKRHASALSGMLFRSFSFG